MGLACRISAEQQKNKIHIELYQIIAGYLPLIIISHPHLIHSLTLQKPHSFFYIHTLSLSLLSPSQSRKRTCPQTYSLTLSRWSRSFLPPPPPCRKHQIRSHPRTCAGTTIVSFYRARRGWLRIACMGLRTWLGRVVRILIMWRWVRGGRKRLCGGVRCIYRMWRGRESCFLCLFCFCPRKLVRLMDWCWC